MYKIISIVGARPQFIKAAAISRTIREHFSLTLNHILVHTGQHYDFNMSSVFFDELQMENPTYQLNIHTENGNYPINHAADEIKKILLAEQPDMVIVYGDTFSTLAGALAAEICNMPLAHIESGMRSFNNHMPEEYNRIETDKRASYLFCSTQTAVNNLYNEGFQKNKKIILCGDIMYDHVLYFKKEKNIVSAEFKRKFETFSSYLLVTIHRQQNTDNEERLRNLLSGLLSIAEIQQHIVLPLHPRTQKMMLNFLSQDEYNALYFNSFIHILSPFSYLEMMYAEQHALMIVTDSGGVQKEAFFYQKPCIILRNETEWTELVDNKCSILSDVKPENIFSAYQYFLKNPPTHFPPLFGNGNTATIICHEIMNALNA